MAWVYGGLERIIYVVKVPNGNISYIIERENTFMHCPHCDIAIHAGFSIREIGACGQDEHGSTYYWYALSQACPSCLKPIIKLRKDKRVEGSWVSDEFMAFPQRGVRAPAPAEVPTAIAIDFNEAGLVLELSAQASAALSRRCLQHLLANTGLSKNSNLDRAIEEAKSKGLPSYIAEQLDAIRVIGNFAAHTQKSVNTGEILPVEPHEAEWNLDVLDMLFDFCYVHPAKTAARRATLDEKLAEAGKPPLK